RFDFSAPSSTGTLIAASPRPSTRPVHCRTASISAALLRLAVSCVLIPASLVLHESGVGVRDPVLADAVVHDAAEVEMAAVLAHRGDHRVVLTAEVPQRLEHLAALVELESAAGVDVREQPLVARHALGHAATEARHLPRQVERRAAH